MNSPAKILVIFLLIGLVIFVYAFMLTAEPTTQDYAGEEWAQAACQRSYALAIGQPRSFSSCCGGTRAPSYSVAQGGGYIRDFAYTTVDNKTGSLSDLVGYKHVVLIFFDLQSGTCRTALSELQHFYRRFGNKVEILAITSDQVTNARNVRRHANDMGLQYRVIHDPTTAFATTYFHQVEPHVVAIDINGNILGSISGNRSDLDEILQATFDL
jgi:peroxiredoxin